MSGDSYSVAFSNYILNKKLLCVLHKLFQMNKNFVATFFTICYNLRKDGEKSINHSKLFFN